MYKNVTCVIGCSYGDEGKGKVVDVLAQKFDFIVRYQGGDNAGHTIRFDKTTYKLSLIPTGIFNKTASVILTHGVVINPETLIREIDLLKESGFETAGRLFISPNAHLIFDFHKKYDALIERLNNNLAIGTTKRGIGYAYADKMKRVSLQVKDIFNLEVSLPKLEKLLDYYNFIFKANNEEIIKIEDILEKMKFWAKRLQGFVADTIKILRGALNEGKKVLLEGAQGILLDIDYGNYPFVTSSSVANFYTNSGLTYQDIKEVVGVIKAYSTRVGNGFFPTEIHDEELASKIRQKGGEYGTVTRRARRIGWLDLVTIKHVVSICGITSIVISLADVLAGIGEIKICVDYKYSLKSGFKYIFDPGNKPIYVVFPGWTEDISSLRSWEDLPTTVKMYISFIRDYLKVKILFLSVGKEREQIIWV